MKTQENKQGTTESLRSLKTQCYWWRPVRSMVHADRSCEKTPASSVAGATGEVSSRLNHQSAGRHSTFRESSHRPSLAGSLRVKKPDNRPRRPNPGGGIFAWHGIGFAAQRCNDFALVGPGHQKKRVPCGVENNRCEADAVWRGGRRLNGQDPANLFVKGRRTRKQGGGVSFGAEPE